MNEPQKADTLVKLIKAVETIIERAHTESADISSFRARVELMPLLEATLKMRSNFTLQDTPAFPWRYSQDPPGAEVVADFKAFDTAVAKLVAKLVSGVQ
jgi:hypothetical protein